MDIICTTYGYHFILYIVRLICANNTRCELLVYDAWNFAHSLNLFVYFAPAEG